MNKGDKVHVEFDAVYMGDTAMSGSHVFELASRSIQIPLGKAEMTVLTPAEPPVGTMIVESRLESNSLGLTGHVAIVYWHTPEGWKLVANTSKHPGEVPRESSWEEIHHDMESARRMRHWKVTVIEP